MTFAVDDKNQLIAIEEPENHLHPDMQRRLLIFLRDQNARFILTTHSNVFLNNALADRIFFTRYDGAVRIDDATSVASILDDLGYSVADNLVSDLVVLTEGPSDIPVLEELLLKLDLLRQYDIRFWPLGGDIMAQVDLSVFAQRYRIVALVDKDPGSNRVRKRFVDKCQENGIPVHRLKRRAIENYFTIHALRTVFGDDVPDEMQEVDPKQPLQKQLGFNVKKHNRSIARAVAIHDLEGSDLLDWLRSLEGIAKGDA